MIVPLPAPASAERRRSLASTKPSDTPNASSQPRPSSSVARGDYLLSIEAMKMEHRFEAPVSGTVVEVGASPGTQVAPGRLLVRIEPDPA